LLNLGEGNLLPRLLDQRGSQLRNAGGRIQTFAKVPPSRGLGIEGLWWKIIVHPELGDLQDTEGLPVELGRASSVVLVRPATVSEATS
jgi:hypothetical protein